MNEAGKFRSRIGIWRRSNATGTRGDRTDWGSSPAYRRWADVRQLKGSELERARQLYESVTTEFRVRLPRNFDFDATYRVSYKSRLYAVLYVIEPADGEREAVIMAERIRGKI